MSNRAGLGTRRSNLDHGPQFKRSARTLPVSAIAVFGSPRRFFVQS